MGGGSQPLPVHGALFDPLLGQGDRANRPILAQKRGQKWAKNDPFLAKKGSKMTLFWGQKWLKKGSKRGPKRGPKIYPIWPQNDLFWGQKRGQKWVKKGVQNGVKNGVQNGPLF